MLLTGGMACVSWWPRGSWSPLCLWGNTDTQKLPRVAAVSLQILSGVFADCLENLFRTLSGKTHYGFLRREASRGGRSREGMRSVGRACILGRARLPPAIAQCCCRPSPQHHRDPRSPPGPDSREVTHFLKKAGGF